MRPFVLFVVLLAALPLATLKAEERRSIAPIEELISAGTIPISITAETAELQRVATQAFAVHGAFRIDAGGSALHALRFTITGPSSIQVTVSSGRTGTAAFTQNLNGSSLRNALFRAADAAVLYLTKRPGFFAGKLTFVSELTGNSEIYISDFFFGGEALRLTTDRSQAVTPRWSPDGRRILYTSYYRNGFPDIYVIDVGVSPPKRDVFVSLKGTNNGARFSPDGQRVAMTLSGDGNPDVYISNAAGRSIGRVARTPYIEATPSWSADGTQLVVASDRLATGKPQLCLVSATTGGANTLRTIATNISNYCAEPDWSHGDPDLIAFTVASGRGYEIAVYSFKAQKAEVVTNTTGDAIEPCWLPDGRHFIYTVRSANSSRIYIFDRLTKRATPLSPTSAGKAYQANYILR